MIIVFPLIWANSGQWPPSFGGSIIQNTSFTEIFTFFEASVIILSGTLEKPAHWNQRRCSTCIVKVECSALWFHGMNLWDFRLSLAEIHQNRPCLLSSAGVFTVLSRSWGSGRQLEGRLWRQKGQKQSYENKKHSTLALYTSVTPQWIQSANIWTHSTYL